MLAIRYAVGEDHLTKRTVGYTFGRRITHDSMRAKRTHRLGTMTHHQVGCLGDSSGSVSHIVYKDHIFILDIADHSHSSHDIGLGTLFVTEHKWQVQILGVVVCTLRTTHVGCGDHHILKTQRLDIGYEHRRSIKMVDRNIKKALYLIGMKIHRDHTVYTGSAEHVGHKLCGDRHTRLVLTVLTGPSEIRNHSDDRAGRGTLGRINHKQKFHEIVAIGESRLHEVHLASTDRFLKRDFKFAVGKMLDIHFTQLYAEVFTDFLCEVVGACARKHFQRR